MTQLETCLKALESASKALECIKANDKTVYNYKGDGAKNRDGLILEEGRWATPREIAENELRLIQATLSAQGEQETPTDFRNAGNTNFNRPNGRPEPPTCPKCGRYECTSTDLTGLCGGGTYFDPEMPPIKCQVVNVTLPAPQEPPNPAVGQATSVMAEGMVYKKGDSSKSPSDPFVNLEPKSTETQERCPKCKTEVEWVVPPIPGVKPFFQCQDPDCNWMSDDDFPERKSI